MKREPTIPTPPPFLGSEDTPTQDSAKARVVMVGTEYDSRRMQVDVTAAWDATLAERDRMRRLFNRLEAAISHHKKATPDAFAADQDFALYKARDRILRDYAEGKG